MPFLLQRWTSGRKLSVLHEQMVNIVAFYCSQWLNCLNSKNIVILMHFYMFFTRLFIFYDKDNVSFQNHYHVLKSELFIFLTFSICKLIDITIWRYIQIITCFSC